MNLFVVVVDVNFRGLIEKAENIYLKILFYLCKIRHPSIGAVNEGGGVLKLEKNIWDMLVVKELELHPIHILST